MKSSIVETHPIIASQWHPKNVTSPENYTFGSHKKVWWQCLIAFDHVWQAIIKNRTNDYGCPYCVNQKVISSNCISTTHPEIAAQWHSTKNGNKKPENYTFGSRKKVWWQCSVASDHEWQAIIYSRRTNGCPCCNGAKVVESNSLLATHPEIAAQWHSTKNGNLKPENTSYGSHKKVWWQCSVASDHEWQAIIKSRRINGCPYCSGRVATKLNSMNITHPELILQWHPTKNGDKKPDNYSAGSGTKIWWQCCNVSEHVWQTKISNRKQGKGCPYCNCSKGEKAIESFLNKYKIKFKREHTFKTCKNKRILPFDFIIKYENAINLIEYQGEQHYKPISFGGHDKDMKFEAFAFQNKRDAIKRCWCNKNKIRLLEIPYWDFDKIPEILKNFLKINT